MATATTALHIYKIHLLLVHHIWLLLQRNYRFPVLEIDNLKILMMMQNVSLKRNHGI